MALPGQIRLPSPIRYDAVRHRVWLFGQRCHHGATGTVLAALALTRLTHRRSSLALAATGSLRVGEHLAQRGERGPVGVDEDDRVGHGECVSPGWRTTTSEEVLDSVSDLNA